MNANHGGIVSIASRRAHLYALICIIVEERRDLNGAYFDTSMRVGLANHAARTVISINAYSGDIISKPATGAKVFTCFCVMVSEQVGNTRAFPHAFCCCIVSPVVMFMLAI